MLNKLVKRNHKNNKAFYYLKNHLRRFVPSFIYRNQLQQKLDSIHHFDEAYVTDRVNYYNQLNQVTSIPLQARKLSEFNLKWVKTTYFFDFTEYARYFNPSLKALCLFGDNIIEPEAPAFVKSRPINEQHSNAVVLKWNKIRHFMFIKSDQPFNQKIPLLAWRGQVHSSQPHRVKFLEKYHQHQLCNIGRVNQNELNPIWLKDKMSITEQLNYQFILCIEGNDVASNLKWVMSSNSIPVMPKPKYETWFMEGRLIAGVHYIEIDPDYSDLEFQLNYYLNHPQEAMKIVENSKSFAAQFLNEAREDLISLLVMEKYFKKTGQI